MKKLVISEEINIPEIEDLLADYPRFKNFVAGAGRELFQALMQPEVVIKARVIADLGYPSILAVADMCKRITDQSPNLELDGFTKQFAGSAICTLMKSNGYKKRDLKKSVPYPGYSKGEVYEKNS